MRGTSTKVGLLKGSAFVQIRSMEMRSDSQPPEEDCSTSPELYAHKFIDVYADENERRICRWCGIPEPEEEPDDVH